MSFLLSLLRLVVLVLFTVFVPTIAILAVPFHRTGKIFHQPARFHARRYRRPAQRDVFPSGDTQMTLPTIWFSWKYPVRSRTAVTVSGVLLVVSTVYLRHHDVIDLIGGAAFMALTVLTAPVHYRALGGAGNDAAAGSNHGPAGRNAAAVSNHDRAA